MLTAPEEALAAARNVRARLGRRRLFAPVRRTFVVSLGAGRPPLAELLRGGRGGSVRLKLLLSLIWLSAKAPYDTNYPARAWATLLGLEDPDGRGARRINDAVGWLEAKQFLRVEQRAGQPNILTLLREDGTGEPYSLPGSEITKVVTDEKRDLHRYFQLPNELWTSGWMSILSGPGIAMLLVLLAEAGRPTEDISEVWFSPATARSRYGLSEETRTKGTQELARGGLIEIRRKSITPDTFDFRRMRNVYFLQAEALQSPAGIRDESEYKSERAANDILMGKSTF